MASPPRFSRLLLLLFLFLHIAASSPASPAKPKFSARKNLDESPSFLKKKNDPTPKLKARPPPTSSAAADKVAVKKKLQISDDAKNRTKLSHLLVKPKKSNLTAIAAVAAAKIKAPKHPKPAGAGAGNLPKEPKVPAVKPKNATASPTEADGDLISEFRGLPARLHEALIPDLERLADSVRPAAAATLAPVLLLLLPLCLLTVLVRRMESYLPVLHRALLLVQAYLAIYFATLAIAAGATGLEPLRFFHAASPAAYAWTQAVQSLGYVAYLMLQMIDLAAVSLNTSDGVRVLGLAQMAVGLAVGLHYYTAVFHRAAVGEAPRANWQVHAVYAACFVVVCACARAERRKKAYIAVGDRPEEWKKS